MTPPSLWKGFSDMVRLGFSYRNTVKTALTQAWLHKEDVFAQQVTHAKAQIALLRDTLHAPQTKIKNNDRRFRNAKWQQPFFHWVSASYLLATEHAHKTLDKITTLDPRTRTQTKFLLALASDALSPSNHPVLNPEVLAEIHQTRGDCLRRGLHAAWFDIHAWRGYLNMTKTPPDAFVPGKNIATTPCRVVFQNELIQLLHYEPRTSHTYKHPLLIVTSWINKYYILDLQPRSSFIRWAVEQGFSVFVISWVNPDPHLANKTIADYMIDGPIAALKHIRHITHAQPINVVGYCLGGTLLGMTLAYLNARGHADWISSATFLASLFDFSDPGPMQHLMQDEQLTFYDRSVPTTGLWDGRKIAVAFNLIDMNETIWPFWIRRYLLGKPFTKHPALYWAQDITHVPAPVHHFYLHDLQQKNRLAHMTPLPIQGIDISLQAITQACFFVGFNDDKISPWSACFTSRQLIAAPSTFILAPGGHFSGVTSDPNTPRGHYWITRQADENANSTEWHAAAQKINASWQCAWRDWLQHYGGEKIPAREITQSIADGPGEYVMATG